MRAVTGYGPAGMNSGAGGGPSIQPFIGDAASSEDMERAVGAADGVVADT